MRDKNKFLFVCLGNIVRSPLAEHCFRTAVEERFASEDFEIDSAGTSAYHVGEGPDPRMRRTAARHGLDYEGTARQVTQKDLDHFDYILAMDHTNYAQLMAMAGSEAQRVKIKLLGDFDPQDPGIEIPDPYYSGPEGFEHVYTVVNRAVLGLIESELSDDANDPA
jgi:protein-tyrosine phosphatase